MSDNSRKATDVLISIESKLETLINQQRSQELNNKILSNKISSLIELFNSNNPPSVNPNVSSIQQVSDKPKAQPKINIEAADLSPNAKNIKVSSSPNLSVESNPVGIRRSSRDEPENSKAIENVRNEPVEQFINYPEVKQEKFVAPKLSEGTSVQITQRVVDKSNKSLFLAEVEIKSLSDNTIVAKTRTNSLGKWMTTLPVGDYRVSISKRETNNKSKVEVFQDLNVDGRKNLIQLNDLIIK